MCRSRWPPYSSKFVTPRREPVRVQTQAGHVQRRYKQCQIDTGCKQRRSTVGVDDVPSCVNHGRRIRIVALEHQPGHVTSSGDRCVVKRVLTEHRCEPGRECPAVRVASNGTQGYVVVARAVTNEVRLYRIASGLIFLTSQSLPTSPEGKTLRLEASGSTDVDGEGRRDVGAHLHRLDVCRSRPPPWEPCRRLLVPYRCGRRSPPVPRERRDQDRR